MNHLDITFGKGRILSVSTRNAAALVKSDNIEESVEHLFPDTTLFVVSQRPDLFGRGTKLEDLAYFSNISGSLVVNGKKKKFPYSSRKSVIVRATDPRESDLPHIWQIDQLEKNTSAEVASKIRCIGNAIKNSLGKFHDTIESTSRNVQINVADGRDIVFRFAGPLSENDLKEMRIVFVTVEDYIFRRHPRFLWQPVKSRNGTVSYTGKPNPLGAHFFQIGYGINPVKQRTGKFLTAQHQANIAMFMAGAIIGERFITPEIVENTIVGELTFEARYNSSSGYEVKTKTPSTDGYIAVTDNSKSEKSDAEFDSDYTSNSFAVEFVLADCDSEPPRLEEFSRNELANPANLCKFHLSIDDFDDHDDFEITGCKMLYDGISALDIEREGTTFRRGIRVEDNILTLNIAPILIFNLSKPVSPQALLRKINTSTVSLQTAFRAKKGEDPIFFEDQDGKTSIVDSRSASGISYQMRERKLPTLKSFKVDEMRTGINLGA